MAAQYVCCRLIRMLGEKTTTTKNKQTNKTKETNNQKNKTNKQTKKHQNKTNKKPHTQERFFTDTTHPSNTDIRRWINVREIQIQTRRHSDHNWLHRDSHCDQQSNRFLKLTSLLQVSLVTWRSLPVVIVSKVCVASLFGRVRTALFGDFLYV